MNTTIISGLASSTFILFFIAAGAVFQIQQMQSELSGMREAVAKCESTIPRNQHCRIVYSAEVVK